MVTVLLLMNKVFLSYKEVHWRFVYAIVQVFNGNKDSDNIAYHKLNPPIQAGYIRLRPTAWSNHVSLRMELYGCLGMIII